jgi:hypothetical protein
VDPWFEEGFAEYFSSIEVDSKEARVGKIPEDEYLVLQQNGTMKVADLFRVQQNSSTYNESGSHRTVFYAESGFVMHYLYDNNLIPKLGQYFDLKLNKNVPVEDAIHQSLGMSAADFDKVLRNYVNGGHFKYYPMPTPANILSSEYVTRPLSAADSGAVLADIHLHSRDYHEKAISEFREILNAAPTTPRLAVVWAMPTFRSRIFPGSGILQARGAGRLEGSARALLLGAAHEPGGRFQQPIGPA